MEETLKEQKDKNIFKDYKNIINFISTIIFNILLFLVIILIFKFFSDYFLIYANFLFPKFYNGLKTTQVFVYVFLVFSLIMKLFLTYLKKV